MSDFNSSEIPNSSDYISRQAAIELIHSLYPSEPILPMNRKWWKKKYKPYIEAEKALEMLPSAQPKIKNQCSECQEFDCYGCEFKKDFHGGCNEY